MRTNKAQMSIIGLIMVVVMLIVFSVFAPIIVDTVENTSNYTDSSTGLLLNMIPLFLVLGIIMTIFIYVVPMRPT